MYYLPFSRANEEFVEENYEEAVKVSCADTDSLTLSLTVASTASSGLMLDDILTAKLRGSI